MSVALLPVYDRNLLQDIERGAKFKGGGRAAPVEFNIILYIYNIVIYVYVFYIYTP